MIPRSVYSFENPTIFLDAESVSDFQINARIQIGPSFQEKVAIAIAICKDGPRSGCGVAMWLARRAAVRQSRVRIPPGTPPLVQPRKIQEQKSIGADFSQRSSRRFQRSSRRISPSPRMNIVSIL